MTVGEAIDKAKREPTKDFHIMVDVRDILDLLQMLRESDDNDIRQAIYEIKEMNIDLPYKLNIINANGNVDTYRPVE